MTNPDPIAHLCDRLQQAIASHGTRYRASQIIGAETDEAHTTIHSRLGRWEPEKLPASVVNLVNDLGYLGYRLTVEPISPIPSSGNLEGRLKNLERAIAAHLSNDHGQ